MTGKILSSLTYKVPLLNQEEEPQPYLILKNPSLYLTKKESVPTLQGAYISLYRKPTSEDG
jgi:hypothetical protein